MEEKKQNHGGQLGFVWKMAIKVIYVVWQQQNFFICYLCQMFSCHDLGASSEKCFLLWQHFLSKI